MFQAKVSNPQGEASSDHNQEAPEPSGAVEEKVPIVSASTEAGGPKEGTALLSNPPKSKPFTISLPPRVRKEAPPPPPPPAAQTVVPQEPLPVQPGAQIEPDEQPKDSVQEPLQQENAEKMARDQPSHVPSLSQASRVSTDGDAPKKSASQSSDLPPKEGPSTSEVQKESLVPGIDFTEDPQEDEIDGPLGTSWGTESPQVPELSPENSETESGDGNVEVPPGVGTSGPPSPDISMLVRGQERGGITKDSVKVMTPYIAVHIKTFLLWLLINLVGFTAIPYIFTSCYCLSCPRGIPELDNPRIDHSNSLILFGSNGGN